jgi:hypothetical protein
MPNRRRTRSLNRNNPGINPKDRCNKSADLHVRIGATACTRDAIRVVRDITSVAERALKFLLVVAYGGYHHLDRQAPLRSSRRGCCFRVPYRRACKRAGPRETIKRNQAPNMNLCGVFLLALVENPHVAGEIPSPRRMKAASVFAGSCRTDLAREGLFVQNGYVVSSLQKCSPDRSVILNDKTEVRAAASSLAK